MAAVDSGGDSVAALSRFQQRQLLRIGICDLMGLLDVPRVTRQLSDLADAVIGAALAMAAEELSGSSETRDFCVIAMGKLGGQELNYSSDIDLVFVGRPNGATFQPLAARLIDALTRVTGEGFLYRVDMRLRPWGQVGPLVTSDEGYLRYLGKHARVWEKQALLKARAMAGDLALGQRVIERAAPIMFGLDPSTVRRDVRRMKQRIEEALHRRGIAWGEVKLGVGSIRDVEFVTQYLQLVHGAEHAEVQSPNTLDALRRLDSAGLVSQEDYRILADGYTFLRPVEHLLQMMQSQQTHRLPEDHAQLVYLARRLGFDEVDAGEHFAALYLAHSRAIRSVYLKYLEVGDVSGSDEPGGNARAESVREHLRRMAPEYVEVFSGEEVARHAEMAARLDRDNLVEIWAQPIEEPDESWRVTVVAYDYPGELSLIAGMLFVYGFSILSGQVFTYAPMEIGGLESEPRRWAYRLRQLASVSHRRERRKIVDVFTVRPERSVTSEHTWAAYARDLADLLALVEAGEADGARARLTHHVADLLRAMPPSTRALHPIELEIDNDVSEDYTVLRIDTQDTIGFLYEFTNALALQGLEVARVRVVSSEDQVHDEFYLTDSRGRKLGEARQEELRAATVLVKHFTHLLPNSPDPDLALIHFREFISGLFKRPDWPSEVASLERPEVLEALARLLGVSDFLWEDFLRMQHVNLFPVVRDVEALKEPRTRAELKTALAAELAPAVDDDAARDAINAFKDRETFRVDMRHIQGHIDRFGQFSSELADVVQVVVEATYKLNYDRLVREYGEPKLRGGEPSRMVVCGLGKLGGREIGYASDIELMFVYEGNGRTLGPDQVATATFYQHLVRGFLDTIRARREGIFTIDLRMRPYGAAGSLAVSLDAFRRYYSPPGPAWFYERQALVKLRPVAGEESVGAQVSALRDEYVYTGKPIDVAAMLAMRERQIRHLVNALSLNAKYSRGDLVDVEYLVQALQMKHGHLFPEVRHPNTREAMKALAQAGALSPEDYQQLRDAHIFLRHLIDALRMERGNARDLTVPASESAAFGFLARRLGYGDDLHGLQSDIHEHSANVQALTGRLLTVD